MLLVAAMLLGLCSCFRDTPETKAAFAAYEAAVKQSIAHKKGSIIVETKNIDTVLNTESLVVTDYDFVTDENDKVSFERNDYNDGALAASYYADGKKAYQMNLETDQWVDVTEDSKEMLNHHTNYMNTLSLYRIDNNFSYSKHFYKSLTMKEEGEQKVITFVLKSSAISQMFEMSDKRGLKRTMSAQSRSYYVGKSGDLEKIVINMEQDVVYKGQKGTLTNVITVTMDYE